MAAAAQPFLSADYARDSLAWHLAVFYVVYGAFYGVHYVWRPAAVAARKLSRDAYPHDELVGKEVRRSTVSVLIAWAMDLAVMHCLDRDVGGVRAALQLAPGADGRSNRWMVPRDELDIALLLKLVLIGLLWGDLHFYVVHRLLHEVPFLYKHVHKIHHESRNPDTFSGLSFHPVESVMYFSSMLSFLLMPQPLWAYHVMRFALILSPIGGHTAHAPAWAPYTPGQARPWYLLADPVDHWLHHTKFNYNFASGIFPGGGIWDNLFGTAYDDKADSSSSARAKSAAIQAALVSGSKGKPE